MRELETGKKKGLADSTGFRLHSSMNGLNTCPGPMLGGPHHQVAVREMGLHSLWEQHLQAKGTDPAGEAKGAPGTGNRVIKAWD